MTFKNIGSVINKDSFVEEYIDDFFNIITVGGSGYTSFLNCVGKFKPEKPTFKKEALYHAQNHTSYLSLNNDNYEGLEKTLYEKITEKSNYEITEKLILGIVLACRINIIILQSHDHSIEKYIINPVLGYGFLMYSKSDDTYSFLEPKTHKNCLNYQMIVKKNGDDIEFLNIIAITDSQIFFLSMND
jgi:hypothetical protein